MKMRKLFFVLVLALTSVMAKAQTDSIRGQVTDKDGVPVELANVMQPNLARPSTAHPNRLIMEKDYAKNGLEHVLRKCGVIGWRHDISFFLIKTKSVLFKLLKNVSLI